jgi:sulfide:quinone oxidoreductase
VGQSDTNKHDIVIVGGGSAGITVAAHLKKEDKSLDIAIIDSATCHYYQLLFTLVGAG